MWTNVAYAQRGGPNENSGIRWVSKKSHPLIYDIFINIYNF